MNEYDSTKSLDQPATYCIKLQGRLDEHWSEWFDNLTMTYDERDDTLLTGPVIDQAALHGLLNKVRDMGLVLLLVKRLDGKAWSRGSRRGPFRGEKEGRDGREFIQTAAEERDARHL